MLFAFTTLTDDTMIRSSSLDDAQRCRAPDTPLHVDND